MRHITAIILLGWLLAGPINAQTIHPDYVDGKAYLKLNAPLSEQVWERARLDFGVHSIKQPFRTPGMENVYALRFSKIAQVGDLLETLGRLPEVDYIERAPLYRTTYTPNDFDPIQWGLPQIEAEKAWDLVQGSPDVVIAIVDNAVRTDHEDLAPTLWTNPNEVPGDGVDNDNNGYIDDVNGFDVADDDNDANPPLSPSIALSHGSHVAGIAAAATNNGLGIASIGSGCSFLPVKTKHDTTTGIGLDATAEGIDYAIVSGAKVVNMSFAGQGFSQTVQSLINLGYFQGIIWVAGAGNSGTWRGFFPASYNRVISVGSTEQDDRKSGFSTYHPTLDVMAPGGGIWSVYSADTDTYVYMSGTSMACPMVAGLCGLMLSINPTMDLDEVESCLKSSCDDISALNTQYAGLIGAGRINALNAVLCVPRLAAPVADFTFDRDTVCVGETVEFTDLSQEYPQNWTWNFGDGTSDSSIYTTTHTYQTPGTYSTQLIVSNNVGTDSLVFLDAITVLPAPSLNTTVQTDAQGNQILVASGCESYSWSPQEFLSCTDCPNPSLDPAFINNPVPYYVVTCTTGGCTTTDTVFASALVATQSPDWNTFTLQPPVPNPGQNQVQLAATFPKPGQLVVEIWDLWGRKLETVFSGSTAMSFAVEHRMKQPLATGVYLIVWKYEGRKAVQRWLVTE